MLISQQPFFYRSLPIRNKYRTRAVRTEFPGQLIKKEPLSRLAGGWVFRWAKAGGWGKDGRREGIKMVVLRIISKMLAVDDQNSK